jgi:hypothetical protein
MDRREFIAAAAIGAAAATSSQALAQMAAEEPMMFRRKTRLLRECRKRGDASPDKSCCKNWSPMWDSRIESRQARLKPEPPPDPHAVSKIRRYLKVVGE